MLKYICILLLSLSFCLEVFAQEVVFEEDVPGIVDWGMPEEGDSRESEVSAKLVNRVGPGGAEVERAHESWVELNRLYYHQVIETAHGSSDAKLCQSLHVMTKNFVARYESTMRGVVDILVLASENMSDNDRQLLAKRYFEEIYKGDEWSDAQRILYMCLYSLKNESGAFRPFRFDKSIGLFYKLQSRLLFSWGIEDDDED